MADRQKTDEPRGTKRRRFESARLQHGSHGGRAKKRDLGRGEWSRQRKDRRLKNEQENEKRAIAKQDGTPEDGDAVKQDRAAKTSMFPAFSQEETAAEERRPKRKVAVMVGYSGTGYKGMQVTPTEKTIEGDLFNAFVAAGAISKANANDPKKSSLTRCARTDKGVHAAGNVISLKLIVEDDNIVEKINEHLSEQIRVWGIQRTTGSFSCYQACDSRWYEYLIPSHSLLPPHPGSWLSKQLYELALVADDLAGYEARQAEVASFWDEAEKKHIKPILDVIEEDIKGPVLKALYDVEGNQDTPIGDVFEPVLAAEADSKLSRNDSGIFLGDQSSNHRATETKEGLEGDEKNDPSDVSSKKFQHRERRKRIEEAAKSLRAAYLRAKREYRISTARLDRIDEAVAHFVGTHNFHNYTVQKKFNDPSAKRHIKSFTLNREPIIINGTEWLSLKIHGQSFMMHQIRKIIGMISLTIRCGCLLSRIPESFQETSLSIPKVPGLGLLLERPVFDSYNEGTATKFEREKIDFSRYEEKLQEFKQREIYERIFREEESGNAFHTFYSQIDNFQEPYFLYLSSGGIGAVKRAEAEKQALDGAQGARPAAVDSDDEGEGMLKDEGDG